MSLSPLYTGTINISGMVEFCLLEEIPPSAVWIATLSSTLPSPSLFLSLFCSLVFFIFYCPHLPPFSCCSAPLLPSCSPFSSEKTFWEIPRWFWLYRHGSKSLKALKAVALDHHCLQKLIEVPLGWKMHSGVWFACIQLNSRGQLV